MSFTPMRITRGHAYGYKLDMQPPKERTMPQMTEREQADTIAAFTALLDYVSGRGKEPVIEIADIGSDNWETLVGLPGWLVRAHKYRLKPEPSPPVEGWGNLMRCGDGTTYLDTTLWLTRHDAETFGGHRANYIRTVHLVEKSYDL